MSISNKDKTKIQKKSNSIPLFRICFMFLYLWSITCLFILFYFYLDLFILFLPTFISFLSIYIYLCNYYLHN